MALENAEYIPELVETNPLGIDPVNLGDNHIRLVKTAVKGSFPAFVGTQVTPKFITLTEDELNDAAQKAAAAIITGTWQHDAELRMGNDISFTGEDNAGGTFHQFLKISVGDSVILGNSAINAVYQALAQVRLSIGGSDVGKIVTAALGSLLVNDIADIERKAGFRNPGTASFASADTLVQAHEGQIVSCNGTFALTLPVLEADTTVTIKNAGAGVITLTQSGTTLNWLQGGAQTTGNRSLQAGSVCQVQYTATNTIDLWGNGIT